MGGQGIHVNLCVRVTEGAREGCRLPPRAKLLTRPTYPRTFMSVHAPPFVVYTNGKTPHLLRTLLCTNLCNP